MNNPLRPESERLCGAKTRTGIPCQSHPVRGRRRCRMHGGASGSGAPKGNRNAWKHGAYSGELRLLRRVARLLMREVRAMTEG